MQSRFTTRTISPAHRHAIHFYYDVCPENPRGDKIVYFLFDALAPGPGSVIVCDINGANPITVGRVDRPIDPHSAARAQWIDNTTVAYCRPDESDKSTTILVDLPTGKSTAITGAIRQCHPTKRLAITSSHDFEKVTHWAQDTICLMDLDTGELTRLFNLGQAMKLHPLGDAFEGIEHTHFMHTKWSPTGKRFFFMTSNSYPMQKLKLPGHQTHAVFVADADGSNLRFVTEEYHHPIWGPDDDTVWHFQKRPEKGQDLLATHLPTGEKRVLVPSMLGKHASPDGPGKRVLVDLTNWPGPGVGAIATYQTAQSNPAGPDILLTLAQHDFSQKNCHIHPVFSRSGNRVYFNCSEAGTRQLYALDLH